MSVIMHYDPRIKQEAANAIQMLLYIPSDTSFQKRLDSIILQNSALLNEPRKYFSHRNITYTLPNALSDRRIPRLVPEMRPHMDKYLKDVKDLYDMEVIYVTGFISQALNLSNFPQDYLEIFPTSVHLPIKKIFANYFCIPGTTDKTLLQAFINKNQAPINMIKQRMVLNLLT